MTEKKKLEFYGTRDKIILLRGDELADFTSSMTDTMARAIIKDPTRSFLPWKDYTFKFLVTRLFQEIDELRSAVMNTLGDIPMSATTEDSDYDRNLTQESLDKLLGECDDVGDFLFFFRTKVKKVKE